MVIRPQQGVILVKLAASNYGDFTLPEKSFDSITNGIIISINPADLVTYPDLKVGDTEYHRMFKDDCRVKGENGEKLALINIADILGTSDAPASTQS